MSIAIRRQKRATIPGAADGFLEKHGPGEMLIAA
jgi:hypothetical protein